jgi:hypothetical protein
VRRFTKHFEARPELVKGLASDNPAILEGRTIFPSTVISVTESPRLLISGANQRKLGDRVTKGHWAGMPIFCLTLEERATCPSTCHHWRSCYGNGMHLSRRHQHGADLEHRLARELADKQADHPGGFVVRLHILGDFYDAAYVALWGRWLTAFPALRVFGFTAREEMSDEGILIRMLNRDYPERWVIRFSAPAARDFPGVRYAVALWEKPDAPTLGGAVVCPAQTGRTESCGSCGLCWASEKNVGFIAHSRLGRDGWTGTYGPRAPREPDEIAAASPKRRGRPPKLPAPMPIIAAREIDPDQPVPLRAIEIRAWLRSVGADDRLYENDAELLAQANRMRDNYALPRIRLIPPRARNEAGTEFDITARKRETTESLAA